MAAEPSAAQAKAGAATSDAKAGSDVKARPDGWRYVWHNDRWWYYTPKQHWLVYQGGSWQHYAPEASSAGRSNRRSYSRSPSSNNKDLFTPYFGPPERLWLFRRLYGHDPI